MKALVLTEYNKFEYLDVPDPVPADGEVLIEVRACGICGSDVHGMDGSTGRRRPPIVMGHEAAGVIARLGRGVEGWKTGERVTFDSTIYCGRAGSAAAAGSTSATTAACWAFRASSTARTARSRSSWPCHSTSSIACRRACRSSGRPWSRRSPSRCTRSRHRHRPQRHRRRRRRGDDRPAGRAGAPLARLRAHHRDRHRIGQTPACRQTRRGRYARRRQPRRRRGRPPLGRRGADVAFEVVGATAPLKTALASLRKGGQLTLVGNVSPTVESAPAIRRHTRDHPERLLRLLRRIRRMPGPHRRRPRQRRRPHLRHRPAGPGRGLVQAALQQGKGPAQGNSYAGEVA